MTVTHDIGFGQRSYASLDYMPKRYNTRAKSAIANKYRALQEEQRKLAAEKARVESMEPRTVQPVKRKVSFEEKPQAVDESPIKNDFEVQVDLPDQRAAAKPEKDETSETTEGPMHYYNHPLETDHPFST